MFSSLQNFAAQYSDKGVSSGPGPMVGLSPFVLEGGKAASVREFMLNLTILTKSTLQG